MCWCNKIQHIKSVSHSAPCHTFDCGVTSRQEFRLSVRLTKKFCNAFSLEVFFLCDVCLAAKCVCDGFVHALFNFILIDTQSHTHIHTWIQIKQIYTTTIAMNHTHGILTCLHAHTHNIKISSHAHLPARHRGKPYLEKPPLFIILPPNATFWGLT